MYMYTYACVFYVLLNVIPCCWCGGLLLCSYSSLGADLYAALIVRCSARLQLVRERR